LGPILALVVLAAIIGAAVFVVLRIFDDGGERTTANQPAPTTQAAAATGAPEAGTTPEATQPAVVAAAEETGAPTQEPGGGADPPQPTATSSAPTPTRNAPPSARSMLPTASDMGERYERTEDDKRTREAVAESFSDPAAALSLLEGWEWRENAYRTFEIPAGNDPLASETTVINISIHRFGEEQGAKEALDYFAQAVIDAQGFEEFRIDRIGEQSRALIGTEGGVNVVLYVRNGNYLIRIGGFSPEGDPTQDLIAIAEQIVG
jgi:hypothetical protein